MQKLLSFDRHINHGVTIKIRSVSRSRLKRVDNIANLCSMLKPVKTPSCNGELQVFAYLHDLQNISGPRVFNHFSSQRAEQGLWIRIQSFRKYGSEP